jgi:iron complex outermembrane receptor protein
MHTSKILKSALIGSASLLALAVPAQADEFNIPRGTLETALNSYTAQTGVSLVVSNEAIRGVRSHGVHGNLAPDVALSRILADTGFVMHRHSDGAVTIVRGNEHSEDVQSAPVLRLADATSAHAAAGVETVVVTSSKIKGDIQTVPIAITALSQEQLTSRQIAGGPDLVKEVPNLTFSKTNFTGYNIEIRGIGTQAISVTTDPAVAVAFNDVPFIRNHFFEQEFYDVSQVEVLRGPQGTLYGRNATAGVVNVISAKPTDQFEAMLSADIGNYHNRRYEGMANIPIVDDRLDLRVAGEWTKRDGYSVNDITGSPIDGRDLWSARATLSFNPSEHIRSYLVWEHFQESDDRMRTAKQLCKKDLPPQTVDGVAAPGPFLGLDAALAFGSNYLSQGCLPASLYSPDNFEVPYGYSLPYVVAASLSDRIDARVDPYASTVQSRNLRVIESALNPKYKAKNDTLELNVDYDVAPGLTFTSQTAGNQDFLWSTEDYNRFNTNPDLIIFPLNGFDPRGIVTKDGNYRCADGSLSIGAACASNNGGNNEPTATFCDPQLGCSSRLVAQDLSEEHAWQASQEFRLASNFKGPFNFSVGGNVMHYETEENYYVFINTLTLYSVSQGFAYLPYVPGVSDDHECLPKKDSAGSTGWAFPNPLTGGGQPTSSCVYVDPNSIGNLNNEGHNYFLSQNPYVLNSYALFGETYYNITQDLKLTGGLRWTDDKKHFTDIPSEVITEGYGYPSLGVVNQQWREFTGRAAVNWTPKLDFTDQTLVYGSYAHGYKAGGANPPGAAFPTLTRVGSGSGEVGVPVHPLTFKPEFIDAFELGSKNTLADGALTLNGDVFFYNYKGYQISQIVDRTSINLNFDATVKGAELETSWEPLPGFKLNFAGGYEDTRINNGQQAIDLMDRTAGQPGWMVVKPFPTQASNCILPDYVVAAIIQGPFWGSSFESADNDAFACSRAYNLGLDPVTESTYKLNPVYPTDYRTTGINQHPANYAGFDPLSVDPTIDPNTVNNGLGLPPNNGEGFAKNVGGNELPNAPHFTTSFSAEYTMPVSEDWAATLHSDFYWQSQSFARVFNDRPYDKIRGYSNVNVALILTSASGWQVIGYLKNVFDTTAITGDFLNSDDSGLTTNVFLTDPRLFGVRVTKNW